MLTENTFPCTDNNNLLVIQYTLGTRQFYSIPSASKIPCLQHRSVLQVVCCGSYVNSRNSNPVALIMHRHLDICIDCLLKQLVDGVRFYKRI